MLGRHAHLSGVALGFIDAAADSPSRLPSMGKSRPLAAPCTRRTRAPVTRRVYRLRDACATLQLSLRARQTGCRGTRATPEAAYVAACAGDLAADARTLTLTPGSDAPCVDAGELSVAPPAPWVYLGDECEGGAAVYVVLPTYAAYFYDFTMRWARVAYTEMARQYTGYGIIAQLQTIGGGWASLHRADKSLVCALQLLAVAQAVFDEEVVRKCRLFIGWAHLWNSHPAKALDVFEGELAAARRRGDETHERRCLHAIANARRNPRLAPGGAHTAHFKLVDFWSRAFA